MLNNILLCSICAVVLTGTTYPLFAELLFGAKLSVGPPYFQSTVFPLAVPLFLAMSLGPVLAWKRAELWPALLKLWWAAADRRGDRVRRGSWAAVWVGVAGVRCVAAWLIVRGAGRTR